MTEVGVEKSQFFSVEVQLPQQRHRRSLLIGGQVLLGQPGTAFVPEQIRRRTARNQVAVQDRMHLVFHPGALPHQLRPTQHLAAQRTDLRVW